MQRLKERLRQKGESDYLSDLLTPLPSQNRRTKGKWKSRMSKAMRVLEVNHGLLFKDSGFSSSVHCYMQNTH